MERQLPKHQNTNHQPFFFFLNTINLISCLVAHLSATPPHISNIPPFCPVCFPSFLAASLPAALSSPPPLPPLCASLLPSLLFSPPACLPSSFHLSSLKLTVPKGRGHLRTKWGISRQLCAHSLRWPSIIHSLLTPPFPSLHLHSALFIAPCRLRLYFSVPFFFLKISRLHVCFLHYPLLPLPRLIPFFPLLLFLPLLLCLLDAFNHSRTLLRPSLHHFLPALAPHLYQQLLNSTSLTNSFSFPLSARVSFFFMCFPKD